MSSCDHCGACRECENETPVWVASKIGVMFGLTGCWFIEEDAMISAYQLLAPYDSGTP